MFEVDAGARRRAAPTVGIETRQKPQGWARFGGVMLRRAAKRQADEALAGLAGLVEGA